MGRDPRQRVGAAAGRLTRRQTFPRALAGNGGGSSLFRSSHAPDHSPPRMTGGLIYIVPRACPTPHARIEPPAATLRYRHWLTPVRGAPEFRVYPTGSVLTQGFDAAHSRINILVIARALEGPCSTVSPPAIPETRKAPHFDPLFLTRDQMLASSSTCSDRMARPQRTPPRLEGEGRVRRCRSPAHVPAPAVRARTARQAHPPAGILASAGRADRLAEVLTRLSSGFHTLFARCSACGDEAPAQTEAPHRESVADAYCLDARAARRHLLRRRREEARGETVRETYARSASEIDPPDRGHRRTAHLMSARAFARVLAAGALLCVALRAAPRAHGTAARRRSPRTILRHRRRARDRPARRARSSEGFLDQLQKKTGASCGC